VALESGIYLEPGMEAVMTPKDLRLSLPLFDEFLDRFTTLLADERKAGESPVVH
jgi:hypothetical protein